MSDEQWYWSLTENRAVPARERGPADQVMGPYATEAEAVNWKQKVEARNEAWEKSDKDWNDGDGDGGDGDS